MKLKTCHSFYYPNGLVEKKEISTLTNMQVTKLADRWIELKINEDFNIKNPKKIKINVLSDKDIELCIGFRETNSQKVSNIRSLKIDGNVRSFIEAHIEGFLQSSSICIVFSSKFNDETAHIVLSDVDVE